MGASGGISVLWKSSIFQGTLVEVKRFGLIISFDSVHTNQTWKLVVVYGPCQGEDRDLFVQWLYDLEIPDGELHTLATEQKSTWRQCERHAYL